MKTYVPLIALLLLSSCDKSATSHNAQETHDVSSQASTTSTSVPKDSGNPHDLKALAATLHTSDEAADDAEIEPIITPDGKTQINWSLIHTNTPKADLTNYSYPIALDSAAVRNYAKAYQITDKQAQHSIVVSMASPEVLSKILDQLKNGQYVSHRLTDGANMSLIITTTPQVVADNSDYVFEGDFGRGLVLPVIIEPAQPNP